jgi:hypothetical protein
MNKKYETPNNGVKCNMVICLRAQNAFKALLKGVRNEGGGNYQRLRNSYGQTWVAGMQNEKAVEILVPLSFQTNFATMNALRYSRKTE